MAVLEYLSTTNTIAWFRKNSFPAYIDAGDIHWYLHDHASLSSIVAGVTVDPDKIKIRLSSDVQQADITDILSRAEVIAVVVPPPEE